MLVIEAACSVIKLVAAESSSAHVSPTHVSPTSHAGVEGHDVRVTPWDAGFPWSAFMDTVRYVFCADAFGLASFRCHLVLRHSVAPVHTRSQKVTSGCISCNRSHDRTCSVMRDLVTQRSEIGITGEGTRVSLRAQLACLFRCRSWCFHSLSATVGTILVETWVVQSKVLGLNVVFYLNSSPLTERQSSV
jgi:hypothetical protein